MSSVNNDFFSRDTLSLMPCATVGDQSLSETLTTLVSVCRYYRDFNADRLLPDSPASTRQMVISSLQSSILIRSYVSDAFNGREFTICQNDKEYRYLVPNDGEADQDINLHLEKICSSLSGLEQEYYCNTPSGTAKITAWIPGQWKQGFNASVYQDIIYPRIVAYADCLLKNGNQRVLEICSGDGELASLLFDRYDERISEYHLVDLNPESVESAKKRLDSQISSGRAAVHESDVVEADFLALTKKPVDLAIGCGALNHMVVPSREAALKALGHVTDAIKTGGALVLTGLSNSYIISGDLTKNFHLKNVSIPGSTRSFYVAIKKAPETTISIISAPDTQHSELQKAS